MRDSFVAMSDLATITIEFVSSPTAGVRALVSELEATLAAEYPPEQRHGLPLEPIFQPHIRFFVVRIDGVGVGCGGVALFEDFAEVKRMYVREGARGSKRRHALPCSISCAWKPAMRSSRQ